MNILTKQDKANTVAERWKQSYKGREGRWYHTVSGDSKIKYKALIALGSNPSPEDITSTIGNSSWTRLTCDCCEQEVEIVVQFKGRAHDEYGDTELCKECVTKIAKLIGLQVLL